MRTLRPQTVSSAMIICALTAVVIGASVPVQADTGPGDAPIDLTHATQGACAKRQLSTDRGCIIPPRVRRGVKPPFPESARRFRAQGRVILSATIEVDGTVSSVEMIYSTNPGRGFDEAATDVVRQWKYRPALLGGEPVRSVHRIIVDFKYR